MKRCHAAADPAEATPGVYCACCGQPARAQDAGWIRTAKGGRGFVSDARFASHATEQVIPRTNRDTTRAWRRKFHA
jgi:hypothetical protein